MLKKLPVGIQSFPKMIEENYLYIDKTAFIHKLVTEGQLYFLSRPRRFGKSVLLSTIEALFEGKRELFEGLYIADRWDFEPRPVIRIDFLGVENGDTESLDADLRQRLQEQANRYGVTLKEREARRQLRELIVALASRGKVTVLIDEYDKPILDQLHDEERAQINKRFMATFYAMLKSVEHHIGFLFLIGVSKLTRVSLFSDLNNLDDLTLNPGYAAICGYTDLEMDDCFTPWLEQGLDGLNGNGLRQKIRSWYNGYSWDGKTRVYNPVSILSLLKQQRFSAFWFTTGTPKFLVKMLRSGAISVPSLESITIGELSLDGFEPENIDPIALFFQTGYLTIQETQHTELGYSYRMGFPNLEVKRSFLIHLLADFANNSPGGMSVMAENLGKHLRAGEIDAFCEGFQSIFAAIPYNIFIQEKEAYYHTVVYLTLSLIGVPLAAEIQTNQGRIDAVVETDSRIFVIEFKLGTAAEALTQIHNKQYAQAYRNKCKEVWLLGIGMDPEKRNIADWSLENT